jgi:hypothetical protein
MPRRDKHHDVAVDALIADGWTITDDPLYLAYGSTDVYVDLGAEAPIGALKNGQRIAVEIKSFSGASDVHDLELALGQYILYREVLAEKQPDRVLYLAIPVRAFDGIFSEPLGQMIIRRQQLRLFIFDETARRIILWLP